LLIDLHVHTCRYSLCGRSTPDDMLNQAENLGLQGVVITEHDVYWPPDELAGLRQRHPNVTIFSGTELTSINGDDFLVIGPPAPHKLGAKMEAADIVAVAHELGNLVILAHPYRYSDSVPDVAEAGLIDGIECRSNNIHNYATQRAKTLAARHGLFLTAASDGHHVDMLGLYSIDTDHRIHNERELVEALASRAFRCYTNHHVVDKRNAELAMRAESIRCMMNQGLDNDAIRAQLEPYHCTYTILNGMRAGKDVFWPA